MSSDLPVEETKRKIKCKAQALSYFLLDFPTNNEYLFW